MQLPGVAVEVHKLEAAPLVAYLCRELRVAEIIDAHVTWDRHRTEVSPGTARLSWSIFSYAENRCTGSSGSSGTWTWRPCSVTELRPANFNDDRLARALDKFADADPWRIYHEIALGSPDARSLVLDVIRLDTTSFSVQGSDDPADFDNAPLRRWRSRSS